MTIELDTTLAQAEVLFLSFAQLVADVDRRQAEEAFSTNQAGLRQRGGDAESRPRIAIPLLSDNLRQLLDAERKP